MASGRMLRKIVVNTRKAQERDYGAKKRVLRRLWGSPGGVGGQVRGSRSGGGHYPICCDEAVESSPLRG